MKNAKILFLILSGLWLLLGTGCKQSAGNDKNTDADRLQKEVEEIHDESMSEIGTLRYYQDTLGTLLRGMNVDTNNTNTELKEKFTSVIAELNAADDMMMDWMRNYNPKSSEMEESARLKYLNSEKEKITKVKNRMDEAIRKAENLLKSSNL